MPDEEGNEKIEGEEAPSTPLHAHAEGREDDIEGGMPDDDEQDADQAEKTGGATSGGPGGHAEGEEDPSQV